MTDHKIAASLLLSLFTLAPLPLRAQQPAKPAAVAAPARTEDWSTILLDPKTLQPMSYAVIGKAETPDFIRELLRIQWRVADPIDLYVIKPRGVDHPQVILYLYNYTGTTDRFRDDGWCRRATQGGVAAVAFLPNLSSERSLYRPMKEWFVSELQEALATSTHDVQMMLNYLERRGNLSMKDLGIFGEGSGGSVALLAAAADPRIKVVDVLNPWGDWPDWLKNSLQIPEAERASYLKPEFLSKVEKLDPVAYLPHLKLKALRVQQTMTDPITPAGARDAIAAAVTPSSSLVRYQDEKAHLEAWRATGLSGWLRDHILPPPAALSSSDSQASRPAATTPR